MPRCLVQEHDNGIVDVLIDCPGCGGLHALVIERSGPGPKWKFNGNLQWPTFSPSLLVKAAVDDVCHSFIRDGRIEFLSDCTHALAGQTVSLPEVEGL